MSASTNGWSRTGGLGRRGKMFSLLVALATCCSIAFAPAASAEYGGTYWMQTTGENAGSPLGWKESGAKFDIPELELGWAAADMYFTLDIGFEGELWNDEMVGAGSGEVSSAEVLGGGMVGY